MCELPAEIGLGSRVGGDRCRTQDECAQARDKGFQDVTSVSGTKHGARRSRARHRGGPALPFVSMRSF